MALIENKKFSIYFSFFLNKSKKKEKLVLDTKALLFSIGFIYALLERIDRLERR